MPENLEVVKKNEVMEDNVNLVESLLEKAVDYTKTSYELVKLKALDKTTDVVSSIVPHSLVFLLVAVFAIFLNVGLALWLGEILGKLYYGFFIIAAFYGLLAIIFHFFLHESIKKHVGNYIVKIVSK